MTPTLNDLGSMASLVGLAVTLWVALSVRRIRTSYLVTARLPELARRLRHHASMLATHLNDFDSSRDRVREELVAADVTVQSLRRKVGGNHRKALAALSRAIREGSSPIVDAATTRSVYLFMIRVNEQLKDLQLDRQWDR